MSAQKDMLGVNVVLDRYVSDEVLTATVLDVFARTRTRIFEQGIAANGSAIGSYSTKPLYFNPKFSPRKFAAQGKHGDTKFKSGKPHVTRYFPDGYRGVRAAAGRSNSTVNLDMHGNSGMRGSWLPVRRGGTWTIGFNNPVDAEKARGNEAHFKKVVFELTEAELAAIPGIIESLAG